MHTQSRIYERTHTQARATATGEGANSVGGTPGHSCPCRPDTRPHLEKAQNHRHHTVTKHHSHQVDHTNNKQSFWTISANLVSVLEGWHFTTGSCFNFSPQCPPRHLDLGERRFFSSVVPPPHPLCWTLTISECFAESF